MYLLMDTVVVASLTDMDDGVIGRWVAMVVSLVFYVGEG
jgi:hypothetical protein